MLTRKLKVAIPSVLAAIIMLVSTPAAYADTDGSELQTTAQPDILTLQLGADWAGAEFELKLDFGVFPVPVKANDFGVLTMDLGGSKTYTLRLLTQVTETSVPAQPDVNPDPPADADPTDDPEESGGGIPTLHLVLFIGGLLVGGGALAAFYYFKKRREYYGEEDDDDNDEEDDDFDEGGFFRSDE